MNEVVDRLLGGYERGTVSRRELLVALSALVAGAGKALAEPGAGSAATAPDGGTTAQEAPFRARTLNHTTLFVSDVERSVAFYRRLFGMPVRSRQDNGVNLAAGERNQFLGLYRAPEGADPTIHHVCLGVDDFDPDRAMEALEEHGVDSGRIRMRGETPELYFTDPDGLNVQIQDVRYCGGGGALGDRC